MLMLILNSAAQQTQVLCLDTDIILSSVFDTLLSVHSTRLQALGSRLMVGYAHIIENINIYSRF